MRTQSRQQFEREIQLSQRAHEMRHEPTRSEAALWAAISRGQLGVTFRRQVPIGNRYIADFVAPAVKLISCCPRGVNSSVRPAVLTSFRAAGTPKRVLAAALPLLRARGDTYANLPQGVLRRRLLVARD